MCTDGCARLVNGETLGGWNAIARSLHGRIDIMFGPVITAEAYLTFSHARTHSNNTAEMTAMIKALSFLGPHCPVARDVSSGIYYDSTHAAGVFWHDSSPHTCPIGTRMSTVHDFRSTQTSAHHAKGVYGHTGNLGNECADHAAALGTFDLVLNHNFAARWLRHNFDTAACFGSCNNIGAVLENCVTLQLKQHRYLRMGVSAMFLIWLFLTFTHTLHHMFSQSFSRAQPFYCTSLYLKCAM